MKTFFINIDHDESNSLAGYQGVVIKTEEQEIQRFMTSDPVQDWKNMIRYIQEQRLFEYTIMTLSSVSHFVQDVPGYRFIEEEGIEILEFDETNEKWDKAWNQAENELDNEGQKWDCNEIEKRAEEIFGAENPFKIQIS